MGSKIVVKEKGTVLLEEEKHFKILVNNKEVWVSVYRKCDEFGAEDNTEIFKGKEQLTAKEVDEVLEYIGNVEPNE